MARAPISTNGRIDLSLFGVASDFELLGIIDDLADEDGWTRTYDIRLQLGENPDSGERSGVPSRLSWMSKERKDGYGWLERGLEKGGERRWRLTAIGRVLLEKPDVSKTFERSFEKLTPAQRLTLTRALGEETNASANEVRHAIRRQWNRSLGVRR